MNFHSEVIEELIAESYAPMTRAKSDLVVSYKLWKVGGSKIQDQATLETCAPSESSWSESDDESPPGEKPFGLNEEPLSNKYGRSDSEVAESDWTCGCPRYQTHDFYEDEETLLSPSFYLPMMPEQQFGSVAFPPPSSRTVVISCGQTPECVTLGVPFQPCSRAREKETPTPSPFAAPSKLPGKLI